MNNLIGIVAATAMVFSKHVTSYELLIIGRYLIGVNCGLNTSLVPMYISEIAPLNLRGGLGTVNQLAVTVGLLTSQVLGVDYLLGTDEGWPYLLGIAVFPSILQMVLLPICPESPRYLLISKGQEQVRGCFDENDLLPGAFAGGAGSTEKAEKHPKHRGMDWHWLGTRESWVSQYCKRPWYLKMVKM